jgi:hypothetical protein
MHCFVTHVFLLTGIVVCLSVLGFINLKISGMPPGFINLNKTIPVVCVAGHSCYLFGNLSPKLDRIEGSQLRAFLMLPKRWIKQLLIAAA